MTPPPSAADLGGPLVGAANHHNNIPHQHQHKKTRNTQKQKETKNDNDIERRESAYEEHQVF